ncbi:hypothetical protein F4780DRAFT_455225 [Xylariomycetidae sp. FL0641]|nr:hypothetical protein F4780DRAFT_455225 [Xylariomycetidae sp. FL0641]
MRCQALRLAGILWRGESPGKVEQGGNAARVGIFCQPGTSGHVLKPHRAWAIVGAGPGGMLQNTRSDQWRTAQPHSIPTCRPEQLGGRPSHRLRLMLVGQEQSQWQCWQMQVVRAGFYSNRMRSAASDRSSRSKIEHRSPIVHTDAGFGAPPCWQQQHTIPISCQMSVFGEWIMGGISQFPLPIRSGWRSMAAFTRHNLKRERSRKHGLDG